MLLTKQYKNIMVISIAGSKDTDVSFSADTGSGECLLIASKVGMNENRNVNRAVFVILKERPSYPMIGAETARQIRRLVSAGDLRALEDGPVGGTPIVLGNQTIGQVLESPLPAEGGWYLSRIADLSLAQAAYQLENGRLWLPTMSEEKTCNISMAPVQAIGRVGPHHRDIEAGPPPTIRGPFTRAELGAAPTYPLLWSHYADRERVMEFDADCEGIPIKGKTQKDKKFIRDKIDEIWATASHCHFNRDFRFNSQSTSMQFTARRAMGGRAWLSISLETVAKEKALVLWGNSTFGLLMYWWRANKQQSGRGSIAVGALNALPVLNVNELSAKQLAKAVEIFDQMKTQRLLL